MQGLPAHIIEILAEFHFNITAGANERVIPDQIYVGQQAADTAFSRGVAMAFLYRSIYFFIQKVQIFVCGKAAETD